MAPEMEAPDPELDPEVCWQAVVQCDKQFDGRFVYAVRSTGIYCRPSCPSKRPRREMVAFFRLPEAAEQEGYRPCLRCQPQRTDLKEPLVTMVREVCQIIEKGDAVQSLTLSSLGAQVHLNPQYLQRIFKRIMGVTPRQYAEGCRTRRLKTMFKEGKDVTTALYEAGYGSSSRLYEQSSRRLGMTPATYIRGGKGVKVSYTITDSPFGRLLVAATVKGVCAVSLGDSDRALTESLQREYPAAEIERDEVFLRGSVESLLAYLSGCQPHLDLPLDLKVTAFRWRVYEELRAIPYGTTRSYKDVAEAIGNPKAVRAVARACATNPVALVIPCHRVVRGDGSLAGYRWGLERKESLLTMEKERASSAAEKKTEE
ncbi:MAG TPA: bifunctional DNA-binding transcriptional regulator/O6-methylguanine-DNA methyltransferase Ada [Spirochaetia bacterium]|nr:bifunctional DNA-binding transcriptional regulator/O6-methylguanine-DNA methyltransferase Ada [Spirochaetia bacterium]